MKIFGRVPARHGDADVLVQMTTEELAMIAFFSRGYSEARRANELPPGTKIDVDAAYLRLNQLDDNRRKLDAAIGSLRAVADTLEPLTGIVAVPEPPKAVATCEETGAQFEVKADGN